tara:strand:- start:70490 stop:71608 length:1119 start_codon:yes stop_codon:yes gene_type:complete
MTDIKNKIDELLSCDPFNIDCHEKENKLLNILKEQIKHHIKNCTKYKKWYISNNFVSPENIEQLSDIPFLTSSIFKLSELKSYANSKKIQSSGTTSSNKSTIFIDKQTSLNQTKSLSKILSSLLEGKKRHFFIIDLEPQKNNFNQTMSARQAGMAGYLMGAKTKTYLLKLNENNNIVIDDKNLTKLIAESKKESVLIIGYTYMLYEHIIDNSKIDKSKFNFKDTTKLIHFGGWKKLNEKLVSKKILLDKIEKYFKIKRKNIYDIYGFTEQLGTIYPSSGDGGCKVSSYSHVIVRDTRTLEVLEDGKTGFLQFISPLPLSYPGFSILNDDLGQITSRTINKDNNEIVEFSVNPRLDNAEARGCGDTLPDNYYI